MRQTLLTKRQLLLTAIAILALGLLFVTLANLRGDSNSPPAEIELVTLRPAGFEPSEITRSKGPFVLFVEDRSGRGNSSLGLQRANGERLRTVSLQRNKSQWNDIIDLTPGTYILQDVNNSALRCQITILP
jgi:hypothetical protein